VCIREKIEGGSKGETVFELLLVVGLGAIVVCVLKGRWVRGVAALTLGLIVVIAGYVLSNVLSSFVPALIGNMAFALLAVILASHPAEPGSTWHRSAAVDSSGRRRVDGEPTSGRVGRALVGALLGLLPAVVFLVVVFAVVEIFDLSGDTAQIAFLGPPFGVLGALAGAVIGFNWVPRRPSPVPVREHLPTDADDRAGGRSVFLGVAGGVLAGGLISAVAGEVGFLAPLPAVSFLLVIIGGAVGGFWVSHAGKHRTPPQAPAGGSP
jgi:hypothetical protein